MPHATAYAGKELVVKDQKFFVGLFRWPDEDDEESYFAAILMGGANDTWSTLLQLPPMPISNPTGTAADTMRDILEVFNAKVLEVTGGDMDHLTWLQELKKLFDNLSVQNGKIVTTVPV